MKQMMFAVDFNMHLLDYEYKKLKVFFDQKYQYDLTPTIHKPRRDL